MSDRTYPEPSGWIILRGDLLTAVVGPFKTEDDARTWQTLDTSINGEPESWSAWPLYEPAAATAFAKQTEPA